MQAEQIADAYPLPLTGRPSHLSDPDTLQVFLAALSDGNYRETACKLAGFSKQALYKWIKRAEDGDEAAIIFVDAMEKAEAAAESETVRNVRNASKSPQFWAAGMTWLERKSPEKWGRRQDDSAGPKVQVIIGATDSEVKVNVITNYQTQNELSPTDSLCKPLLTEGEGLAPLVSELTPPTPKVRRSRAK